MNNESTYRVSQILVVKDIPKKAKSLDLIHSFYMTLPDLNKLQDDPSAAPFLGFHIGLNSQNEDNNLKQGIVIFKDSKSLRDWISLDEHVCSIFQNFLLYFFIMLNIILF